MIKGLLRITHYHAKQLKEPWRNDSIERTQ